MKPGLGRADRWARLHTHAEGALAPPRRPHATRCPTARGKDGPDAQRNASLNPNADGAGARLSGLAPGSRLMQKHECTACLVAEASGDGLAIYRPAGRINTPGLLRGMVGHGNTEMNLGLFTDEVTAIAAVLQRDHYRFK